MTASKGAHVRSGQSTVEYLLTMSVVSIAIVAIMLSFDAVFTNGVKDASNNMADTTLTTQGVQSPWGLFFLSEKALEEPSSIFSFGKEKRCDTNSKVSVLDSSPGPNEYDIEMYRLNGVKIGSGKRYDPSREVNKNPGVGKY